MTTSAPTTEIGRGGLNYTLPGWGDFAPAIDEREYAPDLTWPASVQTYRRVKNRKLWVWSQAFG